MNVLSLLIFLINNLFWMVLLYLLIPARRVDPTLPPAKNKKEIELHFPFSDKKDSINTDLPQGFDEVETIDLADVAASFEKQAKAERKNKK